MMITDLMIEIHQGSLMCLLRSLLHDLDVSMEVGGVLLGDPGRAFR
jgi:hypothetical protein